MGRRKRDYVKNVANVAVNRLGEFFGAF